jgi:hypothetical protein
MWQLFLAPKDGLLSSAASNLTCLFNDGENASSNNDQQESSTVITKKLLTDFSRVLHDGIYIDIGINSITAFQACKVTSNVMNNVIIVSTIERRSLSNIEKSMDLQSNFKTLYIPILCITDVASEGVKTVSLSYTLFKTTLSLYFVAEDEDEAEAFLVGIQVLTSSKRHRANRLLAKLSKRLITKRLYYAFNALK